MTQPDTRPDQTRPPGAPPINGHAPAPTPVRDEPDSPRGRRDASAMPGSRAEWLITWIVLALLAGADAFGFFLTLTKLIQRDSLLVAFFVGALALASVAAAHTVGARVRSLREGYGGSVLWVGLVSTLWLSLGGLIAWVRATDTGTTSVSSAAVGDLALPAAGAATDGGFSDSSLQLAGLLLALYLLTGAIAMTHAYRFGDPRTAEISKALRERRRLADEYSRLAYEARLAAGESQIRRDDRERDDEQYQAERGSETTRRDHVRIDGRQQMATHFGSPQVTDALTTDDPTLNNPENRGDR